MHAPTLFEIICDGNKYHGQPDAARAAWDSLFITR